MQFVVIKFGGTSVSSKQAWQNITKITKRHLAEGYKPVIVCSAPSQVSNLLETLIEQAQTNQHEAVLAEIITKYTVLAEQLDLDYQELLAQDLQQLEQIALGIGLLKEASPRIRAQLLSLGELMLTKLGAAYLAQQQLSVSWQAANQLLTSVELATANEKRAYLSVDCDYQYDASLVKRFTELTADVVITQGFIASNKHGETVLLGRGGSDVSAAYFAAKLKAECCEIWTDVPGVYTSNPHLIPESRLLKSLSYAETQEIASMGAKVLHPRCIQPLRENQIPLLIKYTQQPEREGTLVSKSATDAAQIKSILIKTEVILISIDGIDMWRQVGFLADIFVCFKQHGLSIDLVSTSESNVTVSLDKKANLIDAKVLDALLTQLNQFAQTKVIGPCAVIGLVGHHIRAILHKLGDVFSVFEAKQIHLLTQAANDLNLAFVVNEEDALAIAQRLHNLLIEQNNDSMYFGESWQAEFGQPVEQQSTWWQESQQQLLALAEQTTPIYVYQQAKLQQQATTLLQCENIDKVFYAMKANPNPEILKTFYELGLGFECVSMAEVNRVFELFPKIEKRRVLFTPNFAERDEYQQAIDLGVYLTIDNLYPLQYWPELFSGHQVLLRIDPGHGYGHHKYVTTGGKNSKFGIPVDQLDEVIKLVAQYDIKIIGLHAHSGSGISQADNWRQLATLLLELIEKFPDINIIDLGGGLNIIEKPGQKAINIAEVDQALAVVKQSNPSLQIWIEPGRFLVAEAGVLLAKVTQLKTKAGLNYVGINAGMNSLIRPALYGAYHQIVNLSHLHDPAEITANIVGPICESGDTLGYSRLLPTTTEGDVLLIANTGAYGASMSSQYNLRSPAKEIMLFVKQVEKIQ